MYRLSKIFIGISLLFLASCTTNNYIRTTPDIVSDNISSVVEISTYSDLEEETIGMGTGFIVSQDGYIITAEHVVMARNSNLIKITLFTGEKCLAKIVEFDLRGDLALLKADCDVVLNPVILGDSNTLRVGETVILIGHPLGLNYSVMAGIISNLEREISYTDWNQIPLIHIDAAANDGMSGGLVLNSLGEAIGIEVASPNYENGNTIHGFTMIVPINRVKELTDKYIK